MKRVLGSSEQTNLNLLREYLAVNELHAVPNAEAARIVREILHANPNSTRHLMSQIGWSANKAKWGGTEFSKSVWTDTGYYVAQGRLTGPDGYEDDLVKHFEKLLDKNIFQ